MMANQGWSTTASPVLTGRKVIYSAEDEVTPNNIIDIFTAANEIHQQNATDIEYLYNYYKGYQPILNRQKVVRPEINNKIVVNRANEIVSPMWTIVHKKKSAKTEVCRQLRA